jgi:lipopolysaccharide/colanic/teichoic acid biosynthesis glycosyltransferase
MKRIFDIAAALTGLVLLSPLFIVIAVMIKAEDGGPVFFKATRVGLHGRMFWLYKFRTMIVGAEKTGPGITRARDGRITNTGRVLRRYKLDELPQLVNIVCGHMNLVGPRPEDPRYIVRYDPAQMKILAVRPGITSPASLMFSQEESLLDGYEWEKKYLNDIMPAKLSIDLEYFKGNSFMSDLYLILRTIAKIVHFTTVLHRESQIHVSLGRH